jgi:hypothetical protein
MKAILSLTLIAPDEELAKADENYASLHKEMEIDFVPPPGLRILINPEINDAAAYGDLFVKVTNPTGIFEVESVTYITQDTSLRIECNAYEPTLQGFRNYIKFLGFYGFSRLV